MVDSESNNTASAFGVMCILVVYVLIFIVAFGGWLLEAKNEKCINAYTQSSLYAFMVANGLLLAFFAIVIIHSTNALVGYVMAGCILVAQVFGVWWCNMSIHDNYCNAFKRVSDEIVYIGRTGGMSEALSTYGLSYVSFVLILIMGWVLWPYSGRHLAILTLFWFLKSTVGDVKRASGDAMDAACAGSNAFERIFMLHNPFGIVHVLSNNKMSGASKSVISLGLAGNWMLFSLFGLILSVGITKYRLSTTGTMDFGSLCKESEMSVREKNRKNAG